MSARALVLAVVGGWLACVLTFGVSAAVADSVGQITEFTVPTAASQPFAIAAGADGNLWFTEQTANRIGRITPTGQITEFSIPPAEGFPSGIAAGPDGNLWFTANAGDKIGQITPAGQITAFSIPTTDSEPLGIAAGLDGNLWFTEDFGDKIGRITPAGQITEFSIPTAGGFPSGITAGSDGSLWFTESGADKIGQITPTGQITEFAVPTAGGEPLGIAAGADGNLWFTEFGGDKIGKITSAGQITEFAVPTAGGEPFGIAAGADGNLWFTEYAGDKIGRTTPAGQITEISIATPGSVPTGIAAGPDGNLWFTELRGKIGRVDSGASPALRHPPSVTGSAREGTKQVCQGELWADWAGQQPVQNASTGKPPGVQWLLNGTPIAGATSQTYTPTSGDVGRQLACTVAVTYPLLGVTESATSAGVKVLAPTTVAPPGAKARQADRVSRLVVEDRHGQPTDQLHADRRRPPDHVDRRRPPAWDQLYPQTQAASARHRPQPPARQAVEVHDQPQPSRFDDQARQHRSRRPGENRQPCDHGQQTPGPQHQAHAGKEAELLGQGHRLGRHHHQARAGKPQGVSATSLGRLQTI